MGKSTINGTIYYEVMKIYDVHLIIEYHVHEKILVVFWLREKGKSTGRPIISMWYENKT